MELVVANAQPEPAIGDRLAVMAAREGSAAHGYAGARALAASPEAGRNLADAIHYLSVLHGAAPGVVDLVAGRAADPAAREWAARAAEGFARERGFLTRLVVAAGPLPSTPGQAQCEAAVLGQRRALETLASSERAGCALGAAAGLILDWRAIRAVLDASAERLGLDAPRVALPDEEETLAAADALATAPAIARAIGFGADQLLVQHRGLWDLLEARAAARGEKGGH